MSRLRHKLYSVGIGADALSIVEAASRRLVTSLPLAEYLPGAASAASADWAPVFDAALAQADIPTTGDLRLTVSDAWARYFTFAVPAGVGGLAELHMLAAARFESLYGVAPEGWQLAADWKAAGRILVCALPGRLLQVAHALAVGHPRRIDSILPHALRLVRRHHRQVPDEAWLCCFGAGALLALRVVAGEVAHVRRLPFLQAPGGDELAALLEAESLRAGLEMPTALCVLGMLPEESDQERLGGMRVVRVSAAQAARPGRVAESVHLALLGAEA